MESTHDNTINPYEGRYPLLAYRKGVWREIVRYILKDVPPVETVVELGAGYCDFINQFPARIKIGYDLNPAMNRFAHESVDLRIEDALDLRGIEDSSVDLVFASNLLEHFDRSQHEQLLPRIQHILKSSGRLVLVQPNYNLCPEHYFDDDTHQTVFSDMNIGSFLEGYDFSVIKLVPRFLPFSMKSRLPKWPVLVRLYLLSPFKPCAGQMYVVAERR